MISQGVNYALTAQCLRNVGVQIPSTQDNSKHERFLSFEIEKFYSRNSSRVQCVGDVQVTNWQIKSTLIFTWTIRSRNIAYRIEPSRSITLRATECSCTTTSSTAWKPMSPSTRNGPFEKLDALSCVSYCDVFNLSIGNKRNEYANSDLLSPWN